MNTLVLNGTSYAAGLYWLARSGPGATSRAARRLGRPWCVHRGDRTGYAAGDIGIDPEGSGAGTSPEGRPALALALLDHITVDFWMALVEGDTGPAGDSDPDNKNPAKNDPGNSDLAVGSRTPLCACEGARRRDPGRR